MLAEMAGAELKIKTLILDFPTFARNFFKILKAPIGFFRYQNYADRDGFRRAIAFGLQGLTVSFIILTAGWAIPQFLASFAALDVSLPWDQYAMRAQQLKTVLPPSLAREWFKQAELILIVHTLPEERFQRLLGRLRELSDNNPDLLEQAIKGSLTPDDKVDSRRRISNFFFALDPRAGPLLHATHAMVSLVPRYELKPHVDFLLRNLLLWYLTCWMVSWFMPRRVNDPRRRAAFTIGAYLVGFLGPIVQTFKTLVNVYLVTTLPHYVRTVSYILEAEASAPSPWSLGAVPFERLALLVGNLLFRVVLVGIAIGAFFIGTRSVYGMSKARALVAAVLGVAVGLVGMNVVGRLLVILLAPTGLL